MNNQTESLTAIESFNHDDTKEIAMTPATLETKETTTTDTIGFTPALASIADDLATLRVEDLETVNVDINAAVVTAIGCVPELAPFEDRLARLSPETATALAKLDLYARALSQAHARYLVNEGSQAEIPELSKRLVEVRALLLAEASLLVQRKLVEADKLGQLKGVVGFRNQINDVLQLVEVLRDALARGRVGSMLTTVELDDAEAAAQALMVAMGKREQAPQMHGAAAELRQRAFTLFVRSYDELRRGISWLRWHEGDVEDFIPSLYSGRGRSKRNEEETVLTPTPVAPVVAGPVRDVTGPVTPDGDDEPENDPNLPGSDPFIS